MDLKKFFGKLGFRNTFTLFFVLFLILSLAVGSLISSRKLTYKNQAAEIKTPQRIEDYETTQTLSAPKPIYGIKISGNVSLPQPYSFVRAVLIDINKNEYLIYESYPLIANSNNFSITNVCEETCILDGVIPSTIRIEGNSSILKITATSTIENKDRLDAQTKTDGITLTRETIKKDKDKQKITKLTDALQNKKIKWTAGETSVSKMNYQEKRKLMPGSKDKPNTHLPNLQGFEYYKGGVLEMKSATINEATTANTTSNYPASWDWRNRHGQNWMTPVKNQGSCGSCWAFSTAGTIEANTNIYFNNHLNPDLSEQELVSCSGIGSCNGGFPSQALEYIRDNGITNETCIPYQSSQASCQKCSDYINTKHYISDVSSNSYMSVNSYHSEEVVKYDLIHKGVLSSGIASWNHVMPLIGWDNYTDSNIVWIFKNSWGDTWGENGYAKIETQLSELTPLFSIETPIYTANEYQQINCTDSDNDGYCYWGISDTKPSTCPLSCKSEKDCDDSNSKIQIFNQSYDCLSTDEITPTPISPKQALFFEGATGIYVRDNYKQLAMKPQFTLEVWLKPEYRDTEWYNVIISRKVPYDGNTCDFEIGLYSNTNDPTQQIYLDFKYCKEEKIWKDVIFPNNQWSHLAVVRNGTKIDFYQNGTLVKSYQMTTTETIPQNLTDDYLGIGSRKSRVTISPLYKGSLDELRISNVVRDISSLWKNGEYHKPLVADAGTVGLWRFDGNLTDDSYFNNNTNGDGPIQYVTSIIDTIPSPTPTKIIKPNICPKTTSIYARYHGEAYINGQLAPINTKIWAVNPRGETVGCFSLSEIGNYSDFRVYGEDIQNKLPGMRNREIINFYIEDNITKTYPVSVIWHANIESSLRLYATMSSLTPNLSTFGKSIKFSQGDTCSSIQLPLSDKFQIKENFTAEMWFKPDISTLSAGGPGELISKEGLANNTGSGYMFEIIPGFDKPAVRLKLQKSDDTIVFSSLTPEASYLLQANNWYFLKFVKQFNNVKLFINGVLIAETTFSQNEVLTEKTLSQLFIGNWKPNNMPACFGPYNGEIDELRISNIARTDNSIPTSPFIPDVNTMALYHFDGNPNDSSDNNLHGTENGNTEYISYVVSTLDVKSIIMPKVSPTATPTPTPTNTPTPINTPTPTPTPLNMVNNNSFEAWTGRLPDDWLMNRGLQTNIYQMEDKSVSGNYALEIRSQNTWIISKDFITVTPGTKYQLSLWVKNASKAGPQSTNAIFGLVIYNSSGKVITTGMGKDCGSYSAGFGANYHYVSSTNTWLKYSSTCSLPTNAAKVKIKVGRWFPSTDYQRFDDVRLKSL